MPASNEPIRVGEDSGKNPLCPHCEKEIRTLNVRKIKSPLGVRFIYFCDHCCKALGVSHRKGFWMG